MKKCGLGPMVVVKAGMLCPVFFLFCVPFGTAFLCVQQVSTDLFSHVISRKMTPVSQHTLKDNSIFAVVALSLVCTYVPNIFP